MNQTGTGRDVFSGTKDDLRRKLLFKRGTGMFQMLCRLVHYSQGTQKDGFLQAS